MSEPTVGASTEGILARTWRERRNQVIAGGVVGVLVLGLGGYFLVFSGGSGSGGASSGYVASAANHNSMPNAASTSSPTSTDPTVPSTYPADPYNNPFAAIYPAVATSVATATATPPSVPVDTSAATSGSNASGSSPTSAPSTTSSPSAKIVYVKLVAVTDSGHAAVTIDGGSPIHVVPGQTFGTYFKVGNIWASEQQITVDFGDSTPFPLGVDQSRAVVVKN